jgi:hypothetical protein
LNSVKKFGVFPDILALFVNSFWIPGGVKKHCLESFE